VKRREFITLLGGAAAAWPLAARAQPADRVRRIVALMGAYSETDREGQARFTAFFDTLQGLGWIDGRNLRIEYRWGGGDVDRIKAASAELVRSTPDVIVAASNPTLAELQRLTSTVPIVFAQVSDPVGSGFVASLARPGANITGFQNFETAIGGKWLGVLKEAAPNMRRAAVLFGSDNAANVAFLHAAEAVAPSLAVEVTAIDVFGGVEIEQAIAMFASQPDGGLIVVPNVYNSANRGSIFLLAARHRLPAVYPFRFFAAEGGLMSYGPDQIEQWRGAATYVDRILRGEKPGQLPVQAPTKYELVVNLKTAKALGLSIPPAFPLRADEVIE
jgi:putative tryptophan/tyrosine transport system substrate-binding protein